MAEENSNQSHFKLDHISCVFVYLLSPQNYQCIPVNHYPLYDVYNINWQERGYI